MKRMQDTPAEQPPIGSNGHAATNGQSNGHHDSQRNGTAHGVERAAPASVSEERLEFVREGLRYPGFKRAVQYGSENSSYELVFDTPEGKEETVTIATTEHLLSMSKVRAKLVEKLQHELKASAADWRQIAVTIVRIAEFRPVATEVRMFEDRLRDYLASPRFPTDKMAVDDVLFERGVWNVKSFLGTDGRLYLKLTELLRFLHEECATMGQAEAARMLAKLGFYSERVRCSSGGNRREARFWVHPKWAPHVELGDRDTI